MKDFISPPQCPAAARLYLVVNEQRYTMRRTQRPILSKRFNCAAFIRYAHSPGINTGATKACPATDGQRPAKANTWLLRYFICFNNKIYDAVLQPIPEQQRCGTIYRK
ncbi:MAG: hypothetical protein ACK5HT_05965 [Draconibacterium sp.]